jgi:hypothetical protein
MCWPDRLQPSKTLKTGYGLFFFASKTPVNTGVYKKVSLFIKIIWKFSRKIHYFCRAYLKTHLSFFLPHRETYTAF